MTALATPLRTDHLRSVSISPVIFKPSFGSSAPKYSMPEKHRVQSRKRKDTHHPLRDLRIKAGLTLEELSDATKMSPSYLSRLESGSRRLNEDIINRLSTALKCTPADLLMTIPANDGQRSASLFSAENSNAVADLPVYTITKNQDGHPVLSPSADTLVNRPSDYIGIRNAFGVKLENSFWCPRYREGDTLLCNPFAPLKDGCSILVKTNANDVYVGTYQAIETDGLPTKLKLKQVYSDTSTGEDVIFSLKDIEAFKITGTIEA